MGKITYIILVLAVLAVIGGGIYAWFYFPGSGSSSPVSDSSSLSSLSDLSSPSSSLSSYSITDTFPETDTISIGTSRGSVEVKNFYKAAIDTEEGLVILADDDGSTSLTTSNDDNYELIYDRSSGAFYIYLNAADTRQTEAENKLLDILGIGQQEACRLAVSVVAAGKQNNSLSFCPSS